MGCVEEGIVQSVSLGTAKVAMSRTHDCGGCKACIFAGKGDIVILTNNDLGAKTGERVRVDARRTSKNSLLAICLGLGFPLLLLIISAVVCYVTGLADWINLLVSLGVMAVGFCMTIVIDRLFLRKSRLAARIVEILKEDSGNEILVDVGNCPITDAKTDTEKTVHADK